MNGWVLSKKRKTVFLQADKYYWCFDFMVEFYACCLYS
jgi:hypothetical protein